MTDGSSQHARWLAEFEAERFRLCAPARARKVKLNRSLVGRPKQRRPATTPTAGQSDRGSLREADIEMLWKGRHKAEVDRNQGGYSFTKASRFEDASAKAPSITSYSQHLKNSIDGASNSTTGTNANLGPSRIRSCKSAPDLGPGAYISYRSHDAVDIPAPNFTFQRAGARRHIKQGRACFDIPKIQMDPVTLKCPRGMVCNIHLMVLITW